VKYVEKKDRFTVKVCSAKQRPAEELAWCAICQEVKPLFWKDGKLFCFETKFYPKGSCLIVLDSCIADMPTYTRTVRVEGIANIPSTTIPVVKASAIAENILKQALNMLNK
jgi:hypothetical protein